MTKWQLFSVYQYAGNGSAISSNYTISWNPGSVKRTTLKGLASAPLHSIVTCIRLTSHIVSCRKMRREKGRPNAFGPSEPSTTSPVRRWACVSLCTLRFKYCVHNINTQSHNELETLSLAAYWWLHSRTWMLWMTSFMSSQSTSSWNAYASCWGKVLRGGTRFGLASLCPHSDHVYGTTLLHVYATFLAQILHCLFDNEVFQASCTVHYERWLRYSVYHRKHEGLWNRWGVMCPSAGLVIFDISNMVGKVLLWSNQSVQLIAAVRYFV